MPVTPTYPGVYIEEIPSGVRTITGVATSITAFIGTARRGPIDEPKAINSFADYERVFGGLWLGSSMSFAVRDFFINGGAQAVIVRLYHPLTNGEVPPERAKLSCGTLNLIAADPGSWGNALRARVDHNVSAETAIRFGVAVTDLFNLFIFDKKSGRVEEFRNVTVIESPRKIDKVLLQESQLMRTDGTLELVRPAAHPNPPAGASAWDDNIPATCSTVDLANEASDGDSLTSNDFIGEGKEAAKKGLYSLEKCDLFNILCLPPYLVTDDVDVSLVTGAATYCEKRRAMLLVDSPSTWTTKDSAKSGIAAGVGTISKNAVLFFPRIIQPNPLHDNQMEKFVPCGAIAGIFARTDAVRGVWKAPAGLDATLQGTAALSVSLTNGENGELNQLGINCLRFLPPAGRIVWGSRTLQGDDRLASEWKYVPVRRMALFIEESLYRGTQWVVFEPNDEPLWAQIRLNVGAFMHNLFRQGAFQGSTPNEAYYVKCDKESTTQNDINIGIVNIIVGFAPLKPAEFVIIKIQQLTGQIEM